jgi:hypothetical protein
VGGKMNKYLKIGLYGVVVIIATTFGEFLVTLPFSDYWTSGSVDMPAMVNLELLLTAIPACLVCAGCSWLLRLQRFEEVVEHGILWMVMLLINYVVIGLGNANLVLIIGSFGFYVLLIGALTGPIIMYKLRSLN